MANYQGEIAIVGKLDTTDNQKYKLKGVVLSGSQTGEDVLISYRGSIDSLKADEILVRLEQPNGQISDLEQRTRYGYFATSRKPEGFESAQSKEVIWYGDWTDRLKKSFGPSVGDFSIPIVGKVKNFYDLGDMFRSLYFAEENGIIKPYSLFISEVPELMTNASGGVRGISGALERFLTRVDRSDYSEAPREVIIDENVISKLKILTAFMQTGLWYIKMEPQ